MSSDAPVRADSIPVRPAATVMLVRDGSDGLEVFMMQRTMSAAFARGAYVFPGGKVDDADHAEVFEPICDGLDDAAASARLGLDQGGLAWMVAAVREVFEEAGVLLARRAGDDHVVDLDDPDIAARYNGARHAVHDGELSFARFCADEGLLLLVDRMQFVDHWITPVGEKRRFDTRFLIAAAPPAQHPLHDDKETIDSLWVSPAEALRLWQDGELQMLPPTLASLNFLARHDSAVAAVAAAEASGVPPTVLPKMIVDGEGRITGIIRPGQDGYDDADDPEFVLTLGR